MEKSDIEWQRLEQWIATNDNELHNKWQKITTRDNEW